RRETLPDSGVIEIQACYRGAFDRQAPTELGHVGLYLRQVCEPEFRRTLDYSVLHPKSVGDRTVIAKMPTYPCPRKIHVLNICPTEENIVVTFGVGENQHPRYCGITKVHNAREVISHERRIRLGEVHPAEV